MSIIVFATLFIAIVCIIALIVQRKNEPKKKEERSIDELKDLKFFAIVHNNSFCQLLFIYNGCEYNTTAGYTDGIRWIGIDYEDKYVSLKVADFLLGRGYKVSYTNDYSRLLESSHIGELLINNRYYGQRPVKELVYTLNSHRQKYLEFLKNKEIEEQEEKERESEGWKVKEYIY